MPTVSDIAKWLAAFAPLELAAEWDNVGLLLGDAAEPIERVMTCLTVTPSVVEEAVVEKVNLIVTHHPVLFRGTKKLSSESTEGKLLLPLLRQGIAIYSPHTAFDDCPGGINEGLAKRMGLANVQPLRLREVSRDCKLAVFVPDADLAMVSDALFAAGAGIIGHYEQCSYRTSGTGTFFGNENANPAVGTKGRREEVSEWRLEVRVPEAKLEAAIEALKKAHSYEEPAFDIYPLKPTKRGGSGRIGEVTTTPLGELAKTIKAELKADSVQIVGDAAKLIRKVAVACGAAGEYLADAIRAKADAFVTGEVRFHDALSAEAAGIALILPGHYATERPAIKELAEKLSAEFPTLKTWPSRRERDPLQSV